MEWFRQVMRWWEECIARRLSSSTTIMVSNAGSNGVGLWIWAAFIFLLAACNFETG